MNRRPLCELMQEKSLVNVTDTELAQNLSQVGLLAELILFTLLLQQANRLNIAAENRFVLE